MIHHTIDPSISSEASIVRITSNGSISLPATIRKRWGVGRVAVVDRGDLAIVVAVPDDPVTYFRGQFKTAGPTSQQLRDSERSAESDAEQAKAQRVGS